MTAPNGTGWRFWLKWPTDKQQRFHKIMIGLWLAILLSAFATPLFLSRSYIEDIELARKRFVRVSELVHQIKSLRAELGDLALIPSTEALTIVLNQAGLTDDRYTAQDPEQGIVLNIPGATYAETVQILDQLRNRASLQAVDFYMTQNERDPRLCELGMVLVR